MNRFLLALSTAFLFFSCQNQSSSVEHMAMCGGEVTAQASFVSFAQDPEFRAMHPVPKELKMDFRGEIVEFPVAGSSQKGRAYLVKANKPTNRYLLVFHEWWGLNDYVRRESDFWSDTLGINVLAIDLYDGKVATDRESAGKYMGEVKQDRAFGIIEGAANFAGPSADFRTIGWCFGGGWSLQATLQLGERAKGCVMYYGMPEKDIARLKTLNTSVLFIHASKDQWINDQVVAQFESDMKMAEKVLTIRRFDADHAFANPSSPRYREDAARDARQVVYTYLNQR